MVLMTSLPSEIGQLNAFTVLALHRNQLTSLPAEIEQLNEVEFKTFVTALESPQALKRSALARTQVSKAIS